ncbi:MAG: helix-turn-helix transcriptional regulator [Desulfovibrionaceae bacterium]
MAGFALGALLNVGPNFSSRSSASTSDIGAAIRTRRKDLGLSQEALAEKAGVGPRFVLELEKGKDTAEIGKILLVLDALNLELRVTPRG